MCEWSSRRTFDSKALELSRDADGIRRRPHGVSKPMRNQLYIDGKWKFGGGQRWDVINPATEDVVATIALASEQDADSAVEAASKAFPSWRRTSAEQRSALLLSVAYKVRDYRDALIALQMESSGKPYYEAEIDVVAVAETFEFYAELLHSHPDRCGVDLKVEGFYAEVLAEPVGVAALIVPWNFPMVTTSWKLAAALAAGCTAVVKPSEYTPLAELALADIMAEVGFPPGVVNFVPGLGEVVGTKLISDPRVRKVSFTGSGSVGKSILTQTARSVKNVSLELGGKSPIIVFEDADIDVALDLVVAGIFYNAGQVCSATSRLLISESIRDKFVELLLGKIAEVVVGSPRSGETTMGPLISKLHYDRVLAMVNQARTDSNANIMAGGKRPPGVGARGFFFEPTLIEIFSHECEIWNQEVFGPVLCFMVFHSEEEAIALANSSVYGLAATIVTESGERAERVVNNLEAGFITVNAPQIVSPRLSWGGYKESSQGRELGPYGLASFQEIKSVIKAQR
ncbi:betaine-aldehyde dehydrogenase [Pseudomonas sp. NFACC23-1]|nr:betaine-aldehyde dehydrogenase [Pseudomonas sp. NFACC17-2]SEI90834.1 betaine-aldehyde dehydrogenase [Pseudomonas sp. NFACC23-1]SFW17851.1 betaine-aldehyde dehydrogenase [Pseudomonas sp. NFACC16-2]